MRVLVALLVLSSAAGAAEPLTDDEAGKRHYMSAQAYFDQAAYGDALREYQASYRLSKYPAILYQIGQCQERLGQISEAIATFESYLQADPQSKRRASVETTIVNLKERLKAAPVVTAPPPAEVVHKPKASRRWLAPGIVLGVAGALAIGGAGLLATIQPEIDTLSVSDPRAPDYRSRIDALESRANGGYALFGLAGAALVVDVVLWVVAAKKQPMRVATRR